MSEVGQRLADLLQARAEQVKVTFDLDDVKRAGSGDVVVPERREQPLGRQDEAGRVAELGASEYPDKGRVRDWRRRRWMLVAAAAIVMFALGLLAVAVGQDPDSVQTDTVAPTPAPPTNPATPTALLPVDSVPATLPATTTTAPTPIAPEEVISVTRDFIQFGDHLLGWHLFGMVDRVATDDGHIYVLAGRGTAVGLSEIGVLVAFDDAGVERWRIELDGTPTDVVIVDGDPWVLQAADGTVSRIDASDGRILGHVTLEPDRGHWLVGAFGSVWATARESSGGQRLVRIAPDLLTTSIELPGNSFDLGGGCDTCRGAPIVGGGGAIWVPLRDDGVAMIDPDSNEVTVIPVDVIGHSVKDVALDGDVAYVASGDRVTSIVDGRVLASVSPGEIEYLGRVDGAFGVLLEAGRFAILRANDPMVVGYRQTDTDGLTTPVAELDGEAWIEPYYFDPSETHDSSETYDLRRIELLPISVGG